MSWGYNDNGPVWIPDGIGTPPDGGGGTGSPPAGGGTTLWHGGQQGGNWVPPAFTQGYGFQNAMFPSMSEQVGSAIHGSIQAQNYTPRWAQAYLPARQNNNVQMNRYYGGRYGGPSGQQDSNALQGSRTMSNPYPLNGPRNAGPSIGYISESSNPFIGSYPQPAYGGLPIPHPQAPAMQQPPAAGAAPASQAPPGGQQQGGGFNPQMLSALLSMIGGQR